MTDINPDVPDKPIVIPESPVSAQAATLARDVVIVLSALPALSAVLSTHDLNQIIGYLTGQQFAPALGTIVLGGMLAWRQWLARKQHSNDFKMATSSDDRVAITKP